MVKGFAPGILLGLLAMFLDDALNARVAVFYTFPGFSIWPASAMIAKIAKARTA